MSRRKKAARRSFVAACLTRVGGRCRICGATDDLTAHHITNRDLIANGGYVASNGITVCPPCHEAVEDARSQRFMSPSELYALVGSSFEQALRDSGRR